MNGREQFYPMKTLLLVFALFVTRLSAGYLDAFDASHLLPPPPNQINAAEQAADLAAVKINSAQPGAADLAAIRHEEELNFNTYSDITGVTLTAQADPLAMDFFIKVEKETRQATSVVKKNWKRDRPYVTDTSIHPTVTEATLSYPSGHATRGVVYALVLAELFPEKRDALLAFGYNVGWHRVVAGVHYPTDVQGGRTLGLAIAQRMLANPEFQADLAKVKAELHPVATH